MYKKGYYVNDWVRAAVSGTVFSSYVNAGSDV